MYEVELGRLRRQVGEIEATLIELDSAMTSPLVSILPVHAMAARKYAAWQRQLMATNDAASMELRKIVEAKTCERYSGSLSGTLLSEQLRTQAEIDLLELISLRLSASLPQGETD